MRRAHLLVPSILLVSVGLRSLASAQTSGGVTIDVDATASGTPLEPVWAFYGYDEANYTTTEEGEELLRTLVAAHTAKVRVRTHFLFNTGDGAPALKWGSTNLYDEDAEGNPVYDYTLIDQIMDATVLAGALPLFEIGFMPQALSTRPEPYQNSNPYLLDGGSFYPPRDYAAWAALVTAWATHVKQRYPDAEASWQWELWNEPDIGYWRGTFDEYTRLYDYTEAALHAVLPNASLGAPAVASPERNFLSRFLEHCATGTNAVSGQTGTRLDMVSFHAKGGVSIDRERVQMDLGQQLRLHRLGFEAVAASAVFARTPVVISEADPDGCAACPVSTAPQHAYRNSAAYGAYELAMMKRSLELAAELGVELRGVLTWAFTFPDSPYFAGYRALATNGIHLPVLNAFKLLGSLRGQRLPVASSGALPLREILDSSIRQQPDIDALATLDGDRIQILVWHYHDELADAEAAPVTLEVLVPASFAANAAVTHRCVDDTQGNAFSVWVSQGSPLAPSASQLAALREAMEPVVLAREQVVAVQGGAVSLSFELPRFGFSLLELAPSDGSVQEISRPNPTGCSCRMTAPAGAPPLAPLSASLAAALICRQRSRATRRVGSPCRSELDISQ